MNKIILSIAVGLGLSLSCFCQDLPEVMALREIEIHDETNEVIFKNYYTKWCDVLEENTKGMSGWLMKGDRGARINKYVFAYGFDYKAARDYYFPSEPPADYKQFYALPQDALGKLPPGVEGTNTYTDFVVLGYKDIIRPMMGEVIGIHYLEVRPRKNDDLEKFVINEFNAAMHNKVPGLNIYIMKGDRGDMTGKYILVYVIDTIERRNNYFPASGDASDELKKAFDPLMEVYDKLQSFIDKEISYTDYIVVY